MRTYPTVAARQPERLSLMDAVEYLLYAAIGFFVLGAIITAG